MTDGAESGRRVRLEGHHANHGIVQFISSRAINSRIRFQAALTLGIIKTILEARIRVHSSNNEYKF